jgi:hypothetical protein
MQRMQNVQDGKTHHLDAFVFVPSVFMGRIFQQLNFE